MRALYTDGQMKRYKIRCLSFYRKSKKKEKENKILFYKLNEKEQKEEIFVECVMTLFITEVLISDQRQWY